MESVAEPLVLTGAGKRDGASESRRKDCKGGGRQQAKKSDHRRKRKAD